MYPHQRPAMEESLRGFVLDHKLEEKDLPLSKLARLPDSSLVSIAFDGNKILDSITRAVREQDEMSIFTSSTPVVVYTQISQYCDFTALKEYYAKLKLDFRPVFVFNGCGFYPEGDLSKTVPPQPNDIARSRAYLTSTTVKSLSVDVRRKYAARFVIEEEMEGMIVRRFHEKVQDTFRAPYLAWSQIAAFLAPDCPYASEAYGCLELLAFPGVERVITSIHAERGTFDCVTKASVLGAIRKKFPGITEADLCAFILIESKNQLFHVPGMHESIEEMCATQPQGGLSRLATLFLRHSEDRQKLMRRNIGALDAPVMTMKGNCVLLSALYNRLKQSDVGAIFGKPLPSIYYYYFMAGPVMPAPFATASQFSLVDNWPLVDTSNYRKVAENVLPLRVQIAFQLVNFLRLRSRSQLRWLRQYVVFRQQNSIDHRWSPILDPPNIDLASWAIEPSFINPSPDGGIYFLDVLGFSELATSSEVVFSDLNTTLTAVLLRSMDLLGYFTHAMEGKEVSGPSLFSKALGKFICPTLSEYGMLFIELVRTGTLSDTPWVVSVQSSPETYPPGVRFVARALSIIPLNVEGPWTGPFDTEMTAFGMTTRLFGRTMRYLTEVMASLIFSTKCTKVPLSQFGEIIAKLPFSIPTEFNAGFLITFVLLNSQCTLEDVAKTFPELYCLTDDLRTLFWFWSMAHDALLVLLEEGLVDLQLLNEAHALVGDACARLLPDLWRDLFHPVESAMGDLTMRNDGVDVMSSNPMQMPMGMMMPQQMSNGLSGVRY